MISSQQGISGAWRLTGTRKLLAVVETFLWLLVLFWQIASLHCIGRVTSFTAQSFLHTAHTVFVYCRHLQYSTSDIILTDIWPPYLRPTSANNRSNLWHKSTLLAALSWVSQYYPWPDSRTAPKRALPSPGHIYQNSWLIIALGLKPQLGGYHFVLCAL